MCAQSIIYNLFDQDYYVASYTNYWVQAGESLKVTLSLDVKEDKTFKLVRTSNSGHNKLEIFQGKFVFTDNGKLKIQLNGVSEQNTILWQQDYVEVLDTKTGLLYEAYLDFELMRKA